MALTPAGNVQLPRTSSPKASVQASPKASAPLRNLITDVDGILVGNRLISSGTSGDVRSLSVKNPVRNGRIAWREIVNR